MESDPRSQSSAASGFWGDRRPRTVGTRRAVQSIKAEHAAEQTAVEVIADRLTRFASSTTFLIFHVAWFGVWIAWNTRLLRLRPFDPYPFGLLTMIVSLEAIVLSIFVLMAQGRESAIAELREEIALQVDLRTEEEVTKTLQLVAGLYARLGHQLADDEELTEMLKPLDAEEIEQQLITQLHQLHRPPRRSKEGKEDGEPPPEPQAAPA